MQEKIYNLLSFIFKTFTVILMASCFQNCFTGVESTGKITLSKKDVNITAPTPEELYLEDIKPSPVKEWKRGKRFWVTDEKFRLVVEGGNETPIKGGEIIEYDRIEPRFSAGGGESSAIYFSRNGETLIYPVEKRQSEAENELTVLQMPMLIDMDLTDAVKRKLEGKRLWTKSALWLDDSLKYQKGQKFTAVDIIEIEPGNTFFPIKITFKDENGEKGAFLMNIGNSGNESRSFSRLFSLSDPRVTYKHISEENWKAIKREELRAGMTKEECRLSKGNPSDTDAGHSYSSTMEIWKYPDGTLLRFVDGVLVSYQ